MPEVLFDNDTKQQLPLSEIYWTPNPVALRMIDDFMFSLLGSSFTSQKASFITTLEIMKNEFPNLLPMKMDMNVPWSKDPYDFAILAAHKYAPFQIAMPSQYYVDTVLKEGTTLYALGYPNPVESVEAWTQGIMKKQDEEAVTSDQAKKEQSLYVNCKIVSSVRMFMSLLLMQFPFCCQLAAKGKLHQQQ